MNTSTSNDQYFLEYGLERDPFPKDVIDKNIFLTPEINRRLKQAKQHIKSSDKLLLISSAPGSGKSLLAQKLIILKEQEWRVSLTNAHPDSEPESIAHSIIQQLMPDRKENSSQSISMLHKFLEQSYQESLVPVIVIDDAHKLSFSTLQFILQLADLRYNDAFFRFIIFANESINETIAKPGLNELAEGTIEFLSMPCFSRSQVQAYIKYRFSFCGENAELPFTEDQIDEIHKISGGLPRGINIVARQLMLEGLKKEVPVKRFGAINVVLILILLALVGYQYNENINLTDANTSLEAEITNGSMSMEESDKKLVENGSIQPTDDQSSGDYVYSSNIDDAISLKLSDVLTTE